MSIRSLFAMLALVPVFWAVLPPGSSCIVAQKADNKAGKEADDEDFDSYEDLFEAYDGKRAVHLTKLEELSGKSKVAPEEYEKELAALAEIDAAYVEALKRYVAAHTDAEDAHFARYEIAITLSRLEGRQAEAVAAAEEFIEVHPDSELAPAAKFVRAQALFALPGREADAVEALDDYISAWPDNEEADFARVLRVRALLFQDRVEAAKASLREILKQEKVGKDEAAQAFLNQQLADLDRIGTALPSFELAAMDGKTVQSADFRGHPLLVFVWDSNSGVCLEELGYVREAWERYHDKGLEVLAVSVNESRPALEQWMKRNQLDFPVVWVDREEENSLVRRLEVAMIPFNILVDREGEIYRYDVRSDDLLRYAGRMVE